MIYDAYGSEVKIIEVKSETVVTIEYLFDGETDDVNPRTLRADKGLPEIIGAIGSTVRAKGDKKNGSSN